MIVGIATPASHSLGTNTLVSRPLPRELGRSRRSLAHTKLWPKLDRHVILTGPAMLTVFRNLCSE